MRDRTPVIVGVGEICDRPEDPLQCLEPLALMVYAAREAQADAGAELLAQIDHIDVIKSVTIPYLDLPGQVAAALGAGRARAVLGDGSGNGPIREIHNAALRIQRGASDVALVCGAEAQSAVDRAKKLKLRLPWIPPEAPAELFVPREYAHPLALRYGLIIPSQVYPLYENAVTKKWGQTPAEARAESARIWSDMSAVAERNPNAWLRRAHDPEEIAQPSQQNRLLSWPYSKFMVALPSVNQGAAVIITSLAKARALGIAAEKLIYLVGGAAARENDDYLQRDRYDANPSQTAVIKGAVAVMGGDASVLDAIELYSCFPVVPKMTRRLLGVSEDTTLTAAGGLTFFGAPLHNYMTHGAVAMVRKLRSHGSAMGLLYGQGGFVTKHHALVISTNPPEKELAEEYSVQGDADRARGPVPDLVDEREGAASIETFTVTFGRDGLPVAGSVVARMDDGARTLARVPGAEAETIALLTRLDVSPIDAKGKVRRAADGLNEWRAA